MAGDETTVPSSAGSELASELAAAGFEEAREVGRGASGVVYRCNQTALGRVVAIKVLASELDEMNRERFLREGYAMGRLSGHPNIVNILQVGVTSNGRPYIVMPYHSADALAQRLQRSGPLSWPETLRIGVKLCGALETAHKAGTLHRDIKPGNVLTTDYGEPQLTDFGIARIDGGFKTVTGFFSGTIAFTAPEVLSGEQPTVSADIYSLGATLYALIAGTAAHDNSTGEQLIAQYMRIVSSPIPDMRLRGIPADVCTAIERAMSLDPSKRFSSAAEFGRELQAIQRRNGLPPDNMALASPGGEDSEGVPTTGFNLKGMSGRQSNPSAVDPGHTAPFSAPSSSQSRHSGPSSSGPPSSGPPSSGPPRSGPPYEHADPTSRISRPASLSHGGGMSSPPVPPWLSGPPQGGSHQSGPPQSGLPQSGSPQSPDPKKRQQMWLIAAAAALAVLLVIGLVVLVATRGDGGDGKPNAGSQSPTTEAVEQQGPWQPITNARVARSAVAATESDGTIWIFGGVNGDGTVTGRHEGYDPGIDSWKGGDDLPVPVQHAMAVTYQSNPVVIGGVQGNGAASDRVWRVVSSHWVELPHLLQPRSAAAAAVVGDKIIVSGGIDASGKLLNTTEIFDGNTWTLGAPLPTPRQLLGSASDDKLMYAVGGKNAKDDLTTVEAYDPAADAWTTLPALAQGRSDVGVAIADKRLVAMGGISDGQVLKSVAALDLVAKTWSDLPDMGTARHGMAASGVDNRVFAIGGSTSAGDDQVTSSAESIKLAGRVLQPASQWRSLPNSPTARLMMAWAVLDGKIWIAGGMRHGETFQLVESFDPQTGAWQTQPPLPMPLHHATATAYRGEFVVIGGTEENVATPSNKVFVLRGGTWSELPPLTHARAAAAAVTVGDKIIVVGGQADKKLVPQTEIFDGTSWKDAADLPTPREHLAAVTDGKYVYTVGGRFLSADKNSAAFERFDPETNEWVKQPELPEMPTPRGSYGATYLHGRIVAVGGEEPTQVLAVAEMYDIAEKKWTKLTPMPTPRHGEVVAAVNDTVYVIGGADRPTHEGPVAVVEALDFN
jgi:serine/threonine protein kinase/N-acetylneuraminic acid mutarotase